MRHLAGSGGWAGPGARGVRAAMPGRQSAPPPSPEPRQAQFVALVEGSGCRAAIRQDHESVHDPAGFSDAGDRRDRPGSSLADGPRRDDAGRQPGAADGDLHLMLRRLHHEQPEHFAFTPANLEWAKGQIAKYPEGRQASAVIPLLWRAQEQEGWVTKPAIEEIARMLGHGLHPGARGRDLLLHVPAAAGGQRRARAGLRHDLVHDLRRGGPDRGLPRARSRRMRTRCRRTAGSPGRRSSASGPAPTRRWRRSARTTTRT